MKLNTTKKRILSLLLASLMLMSVFGTLTAEAASKVEFESKSGIQYLKSNGKASTSYLFILGADLASQVQNVRSSNPNVATASVKDVSGVCLYIKAVKAGTTTISCTVKGKTLIYKLTVCKYVNPFKKLMLGSKNCASLFNKKKESKEIKNPGGQRKLTVKPKNGWTLTKIVGTYWDPDAKGGSGGSNDKKIKNGKNLDLSMEWMWIEFTLKNNKGVKENFTLYFK